MYNSVIFCVLPPILKKPLGEWKRRKGQRDGEGGRGRSREEEITSLLIPGYGVWPGLNNSHKTMP